jgi:hypothetical protein
MKMKKTLTLGIAMCNFCLASTSLFAQTTAFTYQGRLNSSGAPANGNYDFTFSLYNNAATNTGQIGSTLTDLSVGVTNGLFTVALDFGANYPGAARWLAIGVRTNGAASFTAMTPLQQLESVPYAVTAAAANSVASTSISGTLPMGLLPGFQAASNYAAIGGGQGNSVNGQWATIGGGNNNTNVLASGSASTIAGGQNNIITNGFQGAIGGGFGNSAIGNYATVPGGIDNVASGTAATASGFKNQALAGGAVVSGGGNNTASGLNSAVGGGSGNIASQQGATVGGGYNNSNSGTYATVPGGFQNVASGANSLAAGSYAVAANSGSFVWSDNSSTAAFASSANNQFAVRAAGGVRFSTSGAGVTVDGQPVARSYGYAISSAPYVITQPGAYYLTTNLTVSSGDAIDILANGVTLDLNGFTITSTSSSPSGSAIFLGDANYTNTDITILNGHIVSGTTVNLSPVAFTGAGFDNGIEAYEQPNNVIVHDVSVSGCYVDGINLRLGFNTTVDSCSVSVITTYGIEAATVSRSTVQFCEGLGIYANTVRGCQAWVVGAASFGIDADVMADCVAESNYGTATAANVQAAMNSECFAEDGGMALAAESAFNCYCYARLGGTGISANIANSCTVVGPETINYKYNMP